MIPLKVGINGVEYTNVAVMTPSTEEANYFDVTTMDGHKHKDLKGRKTHWTITFYNRLDATYYELRDVLKAGGTVTLTVPVDGSATESAEYYPVIQSEVAKGYTMDGTFYFNGLQVYFEKVTYDGE